MSPRGGGAPLSGGSSTGGGLKAVSLKMKTNGSVLVPTYTPGGMVDIDPATLDAVVPAATGDLLALVVSAFSDQTATAPADMCECTLDVAFLVGGSRVKRLSGVTDMASTGGIGGWTAPWGQHGQITGVLYHQVTSNMIDSGNVRSRLLFGSYYANKRTLYATATNPLIFQVLNVGQVAA